MIFSIPDVLAAEQVLKARQLFEQAEWIDGRVTAGHQSTRVKDNMQLPEGSPAAREIGATILRRSKKTNCSSLPPFRREFFRPCSIDTRAVKHSAPT